MAKRQSKAAKVVKVVEDEKEIEGGEDEKEEENIEKKEDIPQIAENVSLTGNRSGKTVIISASQYSEMKKKGLGIGFRK